MTIKMSCDGPGCDTWLRGSDGDQMITVSQSVAGEDHHFCSMGHLLAWASNVCSDEPVPA